MINRLAVAFAVLMLSAAAEAAPVLNFNFTFTNKWNPADPLLGNQSGTGVVTGIVRGLTDNATSAATSVEVLSNSEGYGVGEYVGNPKFNSWTVTNGVLTKFFFLSEGDDNVAPAVTLSSFVLDGDPITDLEAGLTNSALLTRRGFGTGLTFTPATPPTPVPLPSTAVLLVGALAALGAQRARAKSA